jgi:hypothetical protein
MVCFMGFVRIFFEVYLFSLFARLFFLFLLSSCLYLLYVVLHPACYLGCCLFGDFSDLLGFNRAIFVN